MWWYCAHIFTSICCSSSYTHSHLPLRTILIVKEDFLYVKERGPSTSGEKCCILVFRKHHYPESQNPASVPVESQQLPWPEIFTSLLLLPLCGIQRWWIWSSTAFIGRNEFPASVCVPLCVFWEFHTPVGGAPLARRVEQGARRVSRVCGARAGISQGLQNRCPNYVNVNSLQCVNWPSRNIQQEMPLLQPSPSWV